MVMQLLKGLTTDSPKAADASTVPKGGSVNDNPTRDKSAVASKPSGREA